MTIKKVSPECEDAKKLLELLSLELEKITGSSGKASFDSNDLKNDRSVFAVCYLGCEPCGCGCFREISSECAEIKRVYSKTRKKGIGRSVISFLEKEAKTLGYKKLILETRKVNENAVKFYLKMGYSITENYGKYKGFDKAVCFSKEI